MTSPFDDLSPRAAWFMENFDIFGLAEICASSESADAKLAALHEGEEELADEGVQPTPAQWIWQWNRATTKQRLDMAGRILQAFDTAEGCFLLNHKTEAPRRKAAEAALGRVRAALDAAEWGGPDRADVIHEIRAALEPPKETPDA